MLLLMKLFISEFTLYKYCSNESYELFSKMKLVKALEAGCLLDGVCVTVDVDGIG